MRDRMKRALDRGEARVDARGVTTTTNASSSSTAVGGGDDVTFRWVTSAWDDEEAPRGYVETLEWINEALAERAARRDARGGGEDETAKEAAEEVKKMGKSPVKGTTSIGRWLSDRRERVRLAAAAAASEDDDDDEDERGKKMRT